MNISRNCPIGVFDSGVGGLTVAKEIIRLMPGESIVYFGDTARVPYGGKSRETITKYSGQIVRFLLKKQVKAVVVACNTASALALDALNREFDIPIIGVIKAGARAAVRATANKKIAVIGTYGTISSEIYPKYIHDLNPNIQVTQKACPLLVPLVEEGMTQDCVTEEIIGRYLSQMRESEIDTLVLGCTHYPLLAEPISRVMGRKVCLVNPAVETSKELRELLEELSLCSDAKEVRHEFYVSDRAKNFMNFAGRILPDVKMDVMEADVD